MYMYYYICFTYCICDGSPRIKDGLPKLRRSIADASPKLPRASGAIADDSRRVFGQYIIYLRVKCSKHIHVYLEPMWAQ